MFADFKHRDYPVFYQIMKNNPTIDIISEDSSDVFWPLYDKTENILFLTVGQSKQYKDNILAKKCTVIQKHYSFQVELLDGIKANLTRYKCTQYNKQKYYYENANLVCNTNIDFSTISTRLRLHKLSLLFDVNTYELISNHKTQHQISMLANSILKNGMQEPIKLLHDSDGFYPLESSFRSMIAYHLNLTVPVKLYFQYNINKMLYAKAYV